MALALTEEEQDLVQAKRKDAADLPLYYSAQTKQEIPIGRDFEAYLILSPSELKSSAISWVKRAVALAKKNEDRDEIHRLLLVKEKENAEKLIAGYDKDLQDFNEFRSKFEATSTFGSVPEVQLFLNDLQSVIDESVVNRDRAFFDETMALVMERFQDQEEDTPDQTEQLQSWSGVLSEYLRA